MQTDRIVKYFSKYCIYFHIMKICVSGGDAHHRFPGRMAALSPVEGGCRRRVAWRDLANGVDGVGFVPGHRPAFHSNRHGFAGRGKRFMFRMAGFVLTAARLNSAAFVYMGFAVQLYGGG